MVADYAHLQVIARASERDRARSEQNSVSIRKSIMLYETSTRRPPVKSKCLEKPGRYDSSFSKSRSCCKAARTSRSREFRKPAGLQHYPDLSCFINKFSWRVKSAGVDG